MLSTQPSPPSPISLALGRIPCGLYIVTSSLDGKPVGFVGSFVMQMGFEPPTVCVGVGKERGPLTAIRSSGAFALSILDAESRGLMSPFFRPPAEGGSAFDGLDVARLESGLVVLEGALAWLSCRVTGEHETGDHVVVFGEVTDGRLLHAGAPALHLRKNGLGY